jgi:translation elongation factor EF-Ts
MSFVITGKDTAGALSLKRETAAAAVKKARELAAEGVVDIEITDPQGRQHGPAEFDTLAAAASA